MKTISLSDEAYARIAALKRSHKDSFSKVILRTIPKRGTAAQMIADIEKLPPLTDKQADTMQAAVTEQNDPASIRDPWTTS